MTCTNCHGIQPETCPWCRVDDFERGEPPENAVTVAVPVWLVVAVRNALRECGEDIIANADDQHPLLSRESHPAIQRRYDRDTLPARVALEAAARLDEFLPEATP